MGILKRRREARQLAVVNFALLWTVSMQRLDELALRYGEAPSSEQQRIVALYDYARYATKCMVALINHQVPGEPELGLQSERQIYFPSELSLPALMYWGSSKGLRQEVAGVMASYMELQRKGRLFLGAPGIPAEYLNSLASYALRVRSTLIGILPL